MTLPDERTRAVLGMAESVRALVPHLFGKSDQALVPREHLRTIFGWLRHYPTQFDMEQAAEKCPDVFG